MSNGANTEPPADQSNSSGEDPEPDDRWFSDMTKFWLEARQDIEGYALKYFSPSTPPNPMLAQEWMNDGAHLVADLWSLWTRGVTLTAVEGGRLVADALRGKEEQAARSQSPGALFDQFMGMVKQAVASGSTPPKEPRQGPE